MRSFHEVIGDDPAEAGRQLSAWPISRFAASDEES
jgi:hypothetical protein